SPLSPLVCNSCGPAACLSGIFGYFCFPDKSYSPISLRSKRGETAFDFRNPGGQPENREIGRASRRDSGNQGRVDQAEPQEFHCGQLRALAKASTDMAPGFNEGRRSVSVKPACS